MSSAPVRQPTTPTPKGPLSSDEWSAMLIEQINALLPSGSKKILVTNNNIANIQRIIARESAGNQAGYLRDNNPLNLNTYSSPHSSLWPNLGQVVPEFGIYIQKFNSVQDGILATAYQFTSPNTSATLSALQNNAPPAVFGASLSNSPWSSGSYANASVFPTIAPANISGTGQPLTVNPTGTLGQINNYLKKYQPGLSAAETAAKDAGHAVTSVGGLIGKITNPTNLKNVGIFVLGMGLTITGLVIVFSQTKQARQLEGMGKQAATVAAA